MKNRAKRILLMALMLSLMEFAHAQSESTSSLFTVDTSYSVPDSDNDGMSDEWELANGLNPNSNDSGQDIDGDGFTNLEEFNNGTHPKLTNSTQLSESFSDLFTVNTTGSKRVMHSIVFFIGECKLKTRMPKNVMVSGVRSYIKSFQQVLLSDEQIFNAVAMIGALKSDKSLNTKAHLESLKMRHGGN